MERSLTENIIKKVALRFLRQYYKFRLRYDDQPVIAKYDLEGVGGIVADGYYSFKKTDGKPFIATFEATGSDSIDEVVYKPENRVLFWDGLAVASIVTLVLTAINFFYDYHELDERELLLRIGMMLLVMLVSFGIFYFIAKNFRRYRYIYAVEQFKRYHADEQWIALGGDVFESSNDKRFRELKDQCVLNGIGLLKVDPNLDTKIMVTPSRQDIFMGKRKIVNFLPAEGNGKLPMKKELGLVSGVRAMLPSILRKDDSIYRFRKAFYNQMFVATGCVLLIGLILFKEMQHAGYQTVDNTEFREDIAKPQSNEVPEQPEALGDSSLTTNTNQLELDEFNRSIWKPKVEQPKKPPQKKFTPPPPEPNPPPVKTPVDTTEIYINPSSEKAIAYDCTRFYNFESKKFIIEEGVYNTWPKAKKRLDVLRRNNIESAALLLACFTNAEKGYVIYIGMIYNSPEEASQKIESLRSTPKNVLSNVESMKIRTLYPRRS